MLELLPQYLLPIYQRKNFVVKKKSCTCSICIGVYWIICFLFGISVSGQNPTYWEGKYEVFSEEYFPSWQDKQGFIWGLSKDYSMFRFDGFDYRKFPFDPNDPEGLQSDLGGAIIEDREEKFWLSLLENYLACYDPASDRFEYFDEALEKVAGKTPRMVYDILEDTKGDIWVSSQIGVFQYSKEKREFQFFANSWAHSVVEDNEGNIWCVSEKDTSGLVLELEKFNESTSDFETATLSVQQKLVFNTAFQLLAVNQADHFLLSGNPTYLIKLKEKKAIRVKSGLKATE